jgi:hypothetical protein
MVCTCLELIDISQGFNQDYILHLWPLLKAILYPLWDILTSWVYFFKGYMYAAAKASRVAFSKGTDELLVRLPNMPWLCDFDPKWELSALNISLRNESKNLAQSVLVECPFFVRVPQ